MQLIGILNLTPDSFSDGGKYSAAETALIYAQMMLSEGAAYIDIGAESTRPGAETITPLEEWSRMENFVKASGNIPLSIDTRNPETAARALKYKNVKILNDVSGLENNDMLELAVKNPVDIIVMHSLTVPADKNIVLTTPPVPTLQDWIQAKFIHLKEAGIDASRIIFDVGVGFGKTAAQSMELISAAAELAKTCHDLGTRILFGHSRKSFLGAEKSNKDIETARITALLDAAGVDFARVHDIQSNHTVLQRD